MRQTYSLRLYLRGSREQWPIASLARDYVALGMTGATQTAISNQDGIEVSFDLVFGHPVAADMVSGLAQRQGFQILEFMGPPEPERPTISFLESTLTLDAVRDYLLSLERHSTVVDESSTKEVPRQSEPDPEKTS